MLHAYKEIYICVCELYPDRNVFLTFKFWVEYRWRVFPEGLCAASLGLTLSVLQPLTGEPNRWSRVSVNTAIGTYSSPGI